MSGRIPPWAADAPGTYVPPSAEERAASLCEHIGEYVTAARWRTPAEVAAYGGPGEEGGGGILADVIVDRVRWSHGEIVEDFGLVPVIVWDYGMGFGMGFGIIPGTVVSFGEAPENDARHLLGPAPAVTP